MKPTRIHVGAVVPAPAEMVSSRVADVDGHDELAAPHIRVLALHGPPGARHGGTVQLRGPVGLRRVAHIAVDRTTAGQVLQGHATTARGATATLPMEIASL
jgi:hypothetical protein